MTTTAHEDQFTDAPEPVRQPHDTGSILRRNVADLEIALKQQAERAEAAESELLAVREDNHSMMMEIDGLRKELAKAREHEREWCAQLCEWLPVGTGYEGKTFAEAIQGEGLGAKLAGGFIPSTFLKITAPVPAVAALAVPLQVWFGSMPESNGKTNWTAILHRGDITEGITIERSEYKDRVRYAADRMRWMIGELLEKPNILKYDAELKEQSAPQTPAVPEDIRSAVCSMLCALDAAIAGDRAHYINKSERARSVSKNWNAANVARAKVVSLLQSAGVRHD